MKGSNLPIKQYKKKTATVLIKVCLNDFKKGHYARGKYALNMFLRLEVYTQCVLESNIDCKQNCVYNENFTKYLKLVFKIHLTSSKEQPASF